jgi:hypothetical protein
MGPREANYFRYYKRLGPIAKLATSYRAWPERDRQGTEGQVSPEAKGGRAGHVTCFIVIAVTGAGTC